MRQAKHHGASWPRGAARVVLRAITRGGLPRVTRAGASDRVCVCRFVVRKKVMGRAVRLASRDVALGLACGALDDACGVTAPDVRSGDAASRVIVAPLPLVLPLVRACAPLSNA